ncbi:MAG: sel1 repeat family protein, partial [Rhodospirillales bacterium]
MRAMRLRLLLAALFALAFVQEARADIGEALAAYASGNYQEALDKARPLADQGNRDALRLMGDMHENGRGLPQNDALAWAHYYKAANGGDVESQFRLGQMYESGRGVPQSYAEASKWFQRAGLTGHTGAKAKLGKLTLAGRGTKVSFNKGLGLIEEAALSGEPEAESLLEDLERRGLASSARLSQDRQAPSDEESAGILLQTKQMVSALSAPFPLSPGLKLGGAPFIKRTAQGAWTVTLPKPAVAQSDGTVWQGASIRLAVTKADEDKLRVKVNLPPLWRYLTARGRENGRLEIGQQSVNGIWSVMLGQWIHTETALSGLTLSSPEGKGGIESLSVFANLTPGINGKGHDLVQTFNLKKASFADQSASGMSIQAIEANSRAESLELDTFRALSGQGKDADLNSLPSLAASFDNHLRLKGLKLTGPGGEEFLSVAGFEASMGALGMDQPASTLKAGIGATGIAATMRAGAAPSPFP